MIKKNEEYIVKIIDNGYQGEGVAKIESIPIFIDNAIKDEEIKIKIIKVQKNFAYGKILEIIKQSRHRTNGDCVTFKRCGGCNLRHMSYEYTLELKKNIVLNCMNKMLDEKVNINNAIGMKNPVYYRNKLQYPIGIDNTGNPTMGVYSSRTHNIIPTSECKIQNELCQKIANDVFEYIVNNKVKVYNEETGTGTVRHVVVRIGIKTNEVLLTIVVNNNDFDNKEKDFVKQITKKYPQIKSIVKNINKEKTNVILGKQCKTLYGSGYIYDILGEHKFKISALSFYQVNPIQTEILYNTALKYIEEKEDIALDLYCGIGTIGIFASTKFKKVYGIEIVEEAIRDAKENAKINNIKNIEFYAGDVEQILPTILQKEQIKPNVVFVDPPRKGLDINTINILLELKPQKIIYVSCNPATLARDLSVLEKEYQIKEIQPIDMFPWTSHVECVTMIELKNQ